MKRIAIILYIMCAVLALNGCKTIQTAHEESKRDTVIVKSYEKVVDSVYVDRYHNVYIKGDTVFKIDSIVKSVLKMLTLTDTLYESKTDTVYQSKERVVNERSSYDKFVSIGFWSLLALIIVCVVVRILIKVFLKK